MMSPRACRRGCPPARRCLRKTLSTERTTPISASRVPWQRGSCGWRRACERLVPEPLGGESILQPADLLVQRRQHARELLPVGVEVLVRQRVALRYPANKLLETFVRILHRLENKSLASPTRLESEPTETPCTRIAAPPSGARSGCSGRGRQRRALSLEHRSHSPT